MVVDAVRKIVLAVLVVLLSFFTLLYAIAYPFYHQGLSEEAWISAVEKLGAIDQLIAHSDFNGTVPPELAQRILGEEWVKTQLRQLIHHGLAYAKGESATVELKVDLTEPKTRWQALTLGQIPVDLPDQVDWLERPGAREAVDEFKNQVQNIQAAIFVSGALALFSILLLALLAKDAKSKVRLPSMGLFGGGFFALTLALQLTAAIRKNLPQEFQDAAFAVVGPLTDAMTTWAAAFLIMGVLGLAASHWFVKNAKEAAET